MPKRYIENCVTDKLTVKNKPCKKYLAFYMGMLAHGVEDAWHDRYFIGKYGYAATKTSHAVSRKRTIFYQCGGAYSGEKTDRRKYWEKNGETMTDWDYDICLTKYLRGNETLWHCAGMNWSKMKLPKDKISYFYSTQSYVPTSWLTAAFNSAGTPVNGKAQDMQAKHFKTITKDEPWARASDLRVLKQPKKSPHKDHVTCPWAQKKFHENTGGILSSSNRTAAFLNKVYSSLLSLRGDAGKKIRSLFHEKADWPDSPYQIVRIEKDNYMIYKNFKCASWNGSACAKWEIVTSKTPLQEQMVFCLRGMPGCPIH